jgi:Na+/H+-dicarboxylate symporter
VSTGTPEVEWRPGWHGDTLVTVPPFDPMTPTTRVVIALAAGLVGGVAISWWQHPTALAAVGVVSPLGVLWVNAIRMTVIPLVVSLLITGVASTSPRAAGRIGGRALMWFCLLVTGGAVLTAVTAPYLMGLVEFDTASLASASAASLPQVELPPFRDWIVTLIPANPVKAASDGAMLPLIVFTAVFALAVTRLDQHHHATLVGFFDAVAHATLVIVEWILAVAPLGVFCLVLPLAARSGLDLIGAMGYFLLVACGLIVVALAALYPVAAVAGGVSIRQFARACAPAQAVAFSTRSSLASLPAMLEGAERDLRLPQQVTGIVLPVAVALFKFASPIARATGTFFVAQLYGIPLGVPEISVITAAIAALSFYSPGVPSGGLFIMTPIYVALQLPIEGIGILIALDLVPDMFITTANVTADMAVTTILARSRTGAPPGTSRPT